MTDQKTKIKDFYMSRDKSELCNHKSKANKQEKKKNVRPSIQPKRRNERLQSPGKSYDLGLKTRGDKGLFWLLWPGHIYGVGTEYSHGSLPIFLFTAPILVYYPQISSCFALEKLDRDAAIKTPLLRPGQHLPISESACHHLSSEQEHELVHYPVFTQTQPQIQRGSHSHWPQEDHNLFQRFQGLIAPWNYLQTFMYFFS